MDRAFIGRAIGAGFLATLIMTILAYAAPLMGLPKMDFAAMLGSLLARETPAPWTGPWWAGMIWHFINGTLIFPAIYALVLYPVLRSRPWLRGTIFGLILWVLSESLVGPMVGLGFFAARAPEPAKVVMASFIGHFLYGAILGSVTGARRDWETRVELTERRAA